MKVFVTGATGLLGFAIVEELLREGHQVTGLARSDASESKLIRAGAQVLRGDIEDLDVLQRGAAQADGAIHTAFYHQITHMRLRTRLGVLLGGSPAGILNRFLKAALDADRNALQTLGRALRGPDRPLIGAFGTMAMSAGKLATEDTRHDPTSAGAARGASEDLMRTLAGEGVRTSIIRLPPIVHGAGDRNGFLPFLIKNAKKKGESAYIGDGSNRWPSVHKADAARLFRLALENGTVASTYHAVAEEGIPFRHIAEAIGHKQQVPVVSKPLAEAAKQFSFLSPFIPVDNPASSALTRQRLNWQPTHADLISDLNTS